MNILSKLALATVVTLSSATLAFAQQDDHNAHHAPSARNGGISEKMVDGEVKKVNKERGKITIRHGELKNLGMPSMTMVFPVKEPAMLDQVKAGDKIKFVAEKIGGQPTVTQLEVQK